MVDHDLFVWVRTDRKLMIMIHLALPSTHVASVLLFFLGIICKSHGLDELSSDPAEL